jgi:hypothetical protein
MNDSRPMPAAGWYPDGVTPGVARWFNGSEWTEQTTPLPDAAGPAAGRSAAARPAEGGAVAGGAVAAAAVEPASPVAPAAPRRTDPWASQDDGRGGFSPAPVAGAGAWAGGSGGASWGRGGASADPFAPPGDPFAPPADTLVPAADPFAPPGGPVPPAAYGAGFPSVGFPGAGFPGAAPIGAAAGAGYAGAGRPGAGYPGQVAPGFPAAAYPGASPAGQVGGPWVPQPDRVGAHPSSVVHWLVPTGRSWQSITAGYLGLFGLLLWPLAPVAVALGIWAVQRGRHGGHGRGRAVFAIVTGLIGTVAGLWVLLVLTR